MPPFVSAFYVDIVMMPSFQDIREKVTTEPLYVDTEKLYRVFDAVVMTPEKKHTHVYL